MILLSDAMVLIDLGYVDGLNTLTKIAPVEVLDVVLQECEHANQPNLIKAVKDAGIKEIFTPPELASTATKYSAVHNQLSLQDSLCLHYAKQNSRILLTNEKFLRTQCSEELVQVHGTIWIMEQAHQRKLKQSKELCGWLSVLSKRERRLPPLEIERLFKMFKCS